MIDQKLKRLYILIKVDVDADVIRSNTDANFYAEKHCDNNEYALVDFYYPDTEQYPYCLLYTSPSPRDRTRSRMPSSA